MARTKTTETSPITAAQLADGDWIPVIDVSDTTMSSTGTNKKLAKSQLAEAAGVTAHLALGTDAHDASSISYNGSSNLSSANVEAALDELDTEKVGQNTTQSAEGAVLEPFKITWATVGAAPFNIQGQSFDNTGAGAGTKNHGLWMGFNVGRHGSGTVTANAPAMAMGFEDNYYDDGGDGFRGMEWYVEFWSPDGTSQTGLRPFYVRWRSDDNTARGAQILSCIGPSGGTGQFSIRSGTNYTGDTNLLTVQPTSVTVNVPMTMVGASPFMIRTTTGQAQLVLSGGTIASAVVFQNALSSSWNISSTSTTSLIFYDKDSRIHMRFTQGATVSAALVDVAASLKVQGGVGFYGTTAVSTKPTVTGAKSSNAALASLLTALASLGLITDSSGA